MERLYGLDGIVDDLAGDFQRKTLHHSLLLTGPRGIGKATAALRLASIILDDREEVVVEKKQSLSLFGDVMDDEIPTENKTEDLIREGSHPDLYIVEKGLNEKTKKPEREIKVKAARDIMDFMKMMPIISHNKVVIIDSVDEMNVNAQNAILKILEEPNRNSYMILVCHSKPKILDTIKSRCREVVCPDLNFEDWSAVMGAKFSSDIGSLGRDEMVRLFELSGQSVSKARNILEVDGLRMFLDMVEIFSTDNNNVERLYSFASSVANDERKFELFGYFVQDILSNLIRAKAKSSEPKIQELVVLLKNILSIEELFQKHEKIRKMLVDVEKYNLNKEQTIIAIQKEMR